MQAALRTALVLITIVGAAACGPKTKVATRPYPAPTAEGVLQTLIQRQGAATTFLAESRMEYWANGQRIKPTVYVMGERGAKVRFNALNPTGGVVAADLACDGVNFMYTDFNNNCELSGLCDQRSIARLLGIRLKPDDFLLLAVGQTPLIASEATIQWKPDSGRELLTLHDALGRKQEVELDGREGRWDVVRSQVWAGDGAVEWTLTNKEFSASTTTDGKEIRLPAKTRFEQPAQKADVVIRWIEREINLELAADKFQVQLQGLQQCPSGPPAPPAP